MNPTRRLIAASLSSLTLVLAPLPALAGGFAVPNANARDLALSEATVAAQTGPEAAFHNPAALAGHDGFAISASFMGLLNATTWSDPTLGTASLDPKLNTPLAAAISYGGKLSSGVGLGMGLALAVVGGGSLNWPTGWAGAQRVQSVSLQLFAVEGGFAVQPVPFLKLGISMIFYRGVETLTQQIGFIGSTGLAELGLGGNAFSFGASAQIDIPGIPLSLAVNYRHKGDLQLRGNVHFTGVPPAFRSLLQDQGVSAHLPVPNQLFAGASYLFPAKVQLMAAWSYERWTDYKEDRFVGDLGFTAVVPRDYRDSMVYRVGLEWSDIVGTGLTARIGGLRSISSQNTDTVSPSLTDGNSWAFSVGAGYQIIPSLRVDLGYQHAIFDPVTATGTEAFPGTYNSSADLFSLGLTFRPGA